MDFDGVYAPNPAPALEIARRGEIDQAAIDAANGELNFPSLQILRRVLDRRGIPYSRQSRPYSQTPGY